MLNICPPLMIAKLPSVPRTIFEAFDCHVSVAIGSLLFVPESKRMSDFVANGPAIPTVRAGLNQLFAAAHSDR